MPVRAAGLRLLPSDALTEMMLEDRKRNGGDEPLPPKVIAEPRRRSRVRCS
jgi:hypothetical protein